MGSEVSCSVSENYMICDLPGFAYFTESFCRRLPACVAVWLTLQPPLPSIYSPEQSKWIHRGSTAPFFPEIVLAFCEGVGVCAQTQLSDVVARGLLTAAAQQRWVHSEKENRHYGWMHISCLCLSAEAHSQEPQFPPLGVTRAHAYLPYISRFSSICVCQHTLAVASDVSARLDSRPIVDLFAVNVTGKTVIDLIWEDRHAALSGLCLEDLWFFRNYFLPVLS